MQPKTPYGYYVINEPELVVHRRGEEQQKPYNLMCSLGNTVAIRRYDAGTRGVGSVRGFAFADTSTMVNASFITGLQNLSYKRMVDKLGDASSLGATLTAERRETWGMVVDCVTRALKAARYVKRLNFYAAARELGIPYFERTVVKRHRIKQPNGRIRTFKTYHNEVAWQSGRWYAKTAGSAWLMYSYGVAPLMGDIYNGMDVLQRDFPFHRIHGYAKGRDVVYDEWNRPGIHTSWTTDYKIRQSVDVRVSNPNLWLANRMGLVNPIQWGLEAIPFSFVVDWFSNLSDVVNSMSDFTGLETSNPCVNTKRTIRYFVSNRWSDTDWEVRDWIRVNTNRELHLVLPKLRFAYERFQWQRGANAISLLVQFLRTK